MSHTAVLLMAYGGPATLDDVAPYLADVRGGRPTPPALLEEVRERYRLIGGGSPLLSWTRRVADALQMRVAGRGYAVRVGMRHWHPYLDRVVADLEREGFRRVLAIPMSPYYSGMSVGAYREKLTVRPSGDRPPAVKPGGTASLEVRMARSWHRQPRFLEACADRLAAARARHPDAAVVFTAHSLPTRILAEQDPYPEHLRETAAAVARAVGVPEWHFAYQSPGRTGEEWLGPFIEEALERLQAAGQRRLLIDPVGFLCDHVEILYDVDILLQQRARAMGVAVARTESLNDHPALVAALEAVVGALDESAPDASVAWEVVRETAPCES